MPDSVLNAPELKQQRARLLRDARLHWFHWLVVGLSLLLTLGAWHVAKTQVERNAALQFQRESSRAAELIVERMQKYEDALWAGVGVHRVNNNRVSLAAWRTFVDTLHTDIKYPGINGLGVIRHVDPANLDEFLQATRAEIPDFSVYPAHSQADLLPIVFIEPVAPNAKAVGLDVAHEANRYAAARQARDTGQAQITGPIVLVQDAQQTPGFLFYAPFYVGGPQDTIADRRANFAGMVYAPFVAGKLIAGTLDKAKRHVDIRLTDGTAILYNELQDDEPDFDRDARFRQQIDIPMYGRTWHLDVWSAASFSDATASAQPLTILISGLTIDVLLLALFMAMARANRNAIRYADQITEALRLKTSNLERSNADLEEFAYVASHDLQEPLRMVGNFTQLLQARYKGRIDDKADQYIDFAVDGVTRMQQLLSDLLQYSRLGAAGQIMEPVDMQVACRHAIDNLAETLRKTGAQVDVGALPTVTGNVSQLTRVLQNLIVNGIKFHTDNTPPQIRVRARDDGEVWEFSVQDQGIGIDPKHQQQIFTMFQRLHGQNEYTGTGVGLAICKKAIVLHGGDIWVESTPGNGSTFYFTIPKTAPMAVDPGPV